MKTISTILISVFFLYQGISQSFWINTAASDLQDSSYDIIKCSDGGFLSVGGSLDGGVVIKFNSLGEIEWKENYNQGAGPSIFISIVEGDDCFFIAQAITGSLDYPNIYKIDLNGIILDTYVLDGVELKELIIDNSGDLILLHRNFQEDWSFKTRVKKVDQSFNVIWDFDIPYADLYFSGKRSFVDNDNNLEMWLDDFETPTIVNRVILDSDGNEILKESYPKIEIASFNSTLHGKLDNNRGVYCTRGGNINGMIRTLSLVDLESKNILEIIALEEHFYWVVDLKVKNNKIYIAGLVEDEIEDRIYTNILVLDAALNVLNLIELKNVMPQGIEGFRGMHVKKIEIDEEGHILASGSISIEDPYDPEATPSSSGFLNMYLNESGGLEDLTSVTEEFVNQISTFPNPCYDQLTINGDFTEFSSLKIYNSTGQLLRSIENGQLPYQLKIEEFLTGQYFSILSSGANTFSNTFQVQR